MAFYPRFLALVIFLALSILGSGQLPNPRRCRINSDCDDGLACTLDYCDPVNSLCFNVPLVENQPPETCPTFAAKVTRDFILTAANSASLTLTERVSIIEYVITQQKDIHPHRAFHLSFLKVNIIPKLRALLRRVKDATEPNLTNEQFHSAIISILNEIDDLHTLYISPSVLRSSLAFLPFRLTEFYRRKNGRPRFAASEVIAEALTPRQRSLFKPGVEIISWNGVPIRKAVKGSGKSGFGANPSAKLARGAQDLTNRFLGFQTFPDAGPFVIKFKTRRGRIRTIRLDWIYTSIPLQIANFLFGIPPATTSTTTAARQIVALPKTVRMANNNNGRVRGVKRTTVQVQPLLSFNLFAEMVDVGKLGSYGLITMYDFSPPNNDLWFAEVKRLLFEQLPQTGVVLDLRNNLGGSGVVCQRVAQLFTTSTVQSIGTVQRTTQLGGGLALDLPKGQFVSDADFAQYQLDVQRSIDTRADFTPFQDGNLTPFINSDGPALYPGPVIVLTSAKSYSCAEVLAINFLDTDPRIGRVIGVHKATGGGGGSLLTSAFLSQFGFTPPPAIFFRSNVFRLERTGVNQGKTFEWFGITPEKQYFPTQFDAKSGDIDLLKFLAKELRGMRR